MSLFLVIFYLNGVNPYEICQKILEKYKRKGIISILPTKKSIICNTH